MSIVTYSGMFAGDGIPDILLVTWLSGVILANGQNKILFTRHTSAMNVPKNSNVAGIPSQKVMSPV